MLLTNADAIPLFGIGTGEEERIIDNGIEVIKFGSEGFEESGSAFWLIYDMTLGIKMANIVERKTLALLRDKLPLKEAAKLDNEAQRAKVLAKSRRNFGSKKIEEMFELRTRGFNATSPLLQHFCKWVANSPALDDVYNAVGSFSWNGQRIWPKSAAPDAFSNFYLSCPNAQGVRNRYRLVSWIYEQLGGGDALSIACGSAQSLIHTKYELRKQGIDDGHLLLTDVDQGSLDLAMERAKGAGVADRVSLLNAPFQDLLQKLNDRKFEIVELCGIVDYLPDNYASALLQNAFSMLRRGGTMIVSNMAKTRGAEILTKTYNWEILYRSPQETGSLIKKAGGKNIKVYVEPWGIHPVAVATV